jgi:hypothetical protein
MSECDDAYFLGEAPEFIDFLIRSIPEVQEVKFFIPPAVPPIQQDTFVAAQERDLIAQALALRESINLPFWDALLLHLSNNPINADWVLRRATLHNPQDLDSFTLCREKCVGEQLRNIIEALPTGRILAISSKILTRQQQTLHLPMLDFHCKASSKGDLLVRSVLQTLGIGGYVARSGQSYHFYGNSLIDESTLINLLGRSLLFCPIVDRAWIAHQLIERSCGLRISPGKVYSHCPEIIFSV